MRGVARKLWRATVLAMAASVVPWLGGSPAIAAGTIDKIRADQTIRIAYRDDAPPFSFKAAGGTEPVGFMVDLCRAVAAKLGEQLGVPSLKIAYVEVTAANRFNAIAKHEADLLCEPTSATLSRRKQVDFSIATFVDGASLLTRDAGLKNMQAMAGQKIGVLSGTTTERALRGTLKEQGIAAQVVPAKTHDEGLAMLDSGKIAAYFADRSILMFLLSSSKAPEKLAIAENYLTVEPYALALPHGDSDFRLAVDTALSHIYKSGEIDAVFQHTFAGRARPTEMLKALYLLSALPD
jgi:ABC-type amino acid transport substrate-binding protein